MTGQSLVEIRHLSRSFDLSKPWLARKLVGEPRRLLKAVQDVSFDINRGETFALVGESGCGKSTVAKMVAGLIRPSAGDVVIDGVSITGPSDRGEMKRLRRRLQMIFQDPYASLNPRWRVDRIIAEPIRAFGLIRDNAGIRERVAELLTLVKLAPQDGLKYPHEFSGGQRQRIAIARALASNPEFLICDEPTSALDVSVQAQILNLMRDLQDELGLTYLFISHNLAVVRHMATRVGVMYLGRIVETAPSRELFRAPQHPYTRMLLAAVPDLSANGQLRQSVQGEVPNPISPPSGCPFHPRCPFAFEPCPVDVPQPFAPVPGRDVRCHGVERGVIPQPDPVAARHEARVSA